MPGMDMGFISLKLSATFIKIHVMYGTIQSPDTEVEHHSYYACYFILKSFEGMPYGVMTCYSF